MSIALVKTGFLGQQGGSRPVLAVYIERASQIDTRGNDAAARTAALSIIRSNVSMDFTLSS
jgi:hypothetical protein